MVAEGVGGGMLDVAHVHKGERAHSPVTTFLKPKLCLGPFLNEGRQICLLW